MAKRIDIGSWLALGVLAGAVALPASSASAQAPDLREISPYLMLVIDTSGSMERLPACTCSTPSCTECLPDCSLANVSGEPPQDATGHELKKNRWAVTLEALTGKFNDFQCEELARSVFSPSFDADYFLPYHQPWHCGTAGTPCAFDDPTSTLSQQDNGILDEYKGRISFGLMTFDGWDTWVGAPPLVAETDFTQPANLALSNGEPGLWSYGGGKSFHYPNCTTDYMMDTGARSAEADQGSLVSINSCQAPAGSATCPSWCTACWSTDPSEIVNQLNDDVQEALLSTRPYGGTPIAASLDDLYYHYKNDLVDDFAGCRGRFALLMTDGYPDDDYRSYGCNCANEGDPMDPDRCGPPPNDPATMHCPYPTPEQAAFDLVHGRTGDDPMIERLFVVGLSVDDQNVLQRLNAIADNGCTATDCTVDADGNEALFANDLPSLLNSLHSVLQDVFPALSRSVPIFAPATASGARQYQIGTGFRKPIERDAPWTGVIERRRFDCDASGNLVEYPLDDQSGDLIDQTIESQAANLITTIPSSGPLDGHVYGNTAGTPCGAATGTDPSGCDLVSLTDSSVTPTVLGLVSTDTAGQTAILDWMYGINGSQRVGYRMGDIYHSSPALLTRPLFDTSDEAFNDFRLRPIVTERPTIMFVDTNDGMIRAISIEDHVAGTNYPAVAAGQQLWGFVPPTLLPRLQDNLTGHQITMDGSPVVKDVYFSRTRGAQAFSNANDYHSVLVSGMRGGGNAYVALDVTKPTVPKFLWQFSNPAMGKTYAKPAIVQATWTIDDGTGPVTKNGAVAILAGGMGELGTAGVDCAGATTPSMRNGSNPYKSFSSATSQDIQHRADVRCWKDQGRALFFVDVATGELIKEIHTDSSSNLIFPSPLVSTPVVYQSDIGTLASRAFVVDADGVIWRIDMNPTDPDRGTDGTNGDPMHGWTARPFYDIFWGQQPGDGEASYEAPLLSVDDQQRLVVIVGTGDTDNFVKPNIKNRVVSLTEVPDPSANETQTSLNYTALANWEKVVKEDGNDTGLVKSELVTGSMALFGGQLYFGTFIAVNPSGNACDLGKGRIHAVDYVRADPNDPNPTFLGVTTHGPLKLQNVAYDSSTPEAALINVDPANAVDNVMIMGLGITQRPSCDFAENFDTPIGNESVGAPHQTQPSIYLVAQGYTNIGSNGPASVLTQNAQNGLLNLQLQINRPRTPVRVVSWASNVE